MKAKKSAAITAKEQRAAFERELKRLVSAQWVREHPEIVAAWWAAPFAGGMLRAGVRLARRRA